MHKLTETSSMAINMRSILLTIFITLFTTGCATSYQPDGFDGGYSSIQLDQNLFQVSFKGNGATAQEKSNDFALLRSAEISIQNGYKYFVIIDGRQYSKKHAFTSPVTAHTRYTGETEGTANHYGNSTRFSGSTSGTATTTFSGGETVYISKPRTSNTILCFAEKPEGFSYNAEFISKSLMEKYKIQKQGK